MAGVLGGTLAFWFAGLYQDWLSGPDALADRPGRGGGRARGRPVRVAGQARPRGEGHRRASSAPTAGVLDRLDAAVLLDGGGLLRGAGAGLRLAVDRARVVRETEHVPSRAALAAVVAAALGVFAPSALAAPPSTLTGQVFSAFGRALRPVDSDRLRARDAPDTLDVRFRATSTTQDTYAGSYVETGELVLKGNRDEFTLQVIRGSAEFTIDSAAGQVTGKKRSCRTLRAARTRPSAAMGAIPERV